MQFLLLIAITLLSLSAAIAQPPPDVAPLPPSIPSVADLEPEDHFGSVDRRFTEDCMKMAFRYLITENEQRSSTVRHIEVFMDVAAFSEDNLKTLFTHISNKYPSSKILAIRVSTNWKQLPLPTDCPPTASSSNNTKRDNSHHQAFFYRYGENAYFRYNPVLNTDDFTSIVLNGKEGDKK
jgi:hypothetical protein